jgi:hypothetical protein
MIDFGEVRSAIHSGGELPDGWMDDERALRYVRDHLDLRAACATREDRVDAIVMRVTCGNVVLFTVPPDEVEAFVRFSVKTRARMNGYMDVTPASLLRTQVMNRIHYGLPLRWRSRQDA